MAAPQTAYRRHDLPSPPTTTTTTTTTTNDQYDQYQRQQQANQQPLTTYQQTQLQKSKQPSDFQYSQPSQQGNTARAKPRSFSFQSHKSQKSHGSNAVKKDLHETSAEKAQHRIHSKADPTLAMNEAEPSAIAAMRSESSVTPLRSLQHKDCYGNAIAEPDRSNPTRSRWERPLDTIRSFEAAIDGGYRRRSIHRSDTDGATSWNRRSSVATSMYQHQHQHQHQQQHQPRFPQESYYNHRPMSIRADQSNYGFSVPGTARNSTYFDGHGSYNGHGAQPPPPARHSHRERQRLHTADSHYQSYGREQQPVYPMPHKDRSYETVTSAAASGNSDPAGYQTDPTSSDNSSIRRGSPAKRQEPVNDYGIGFTQPSQAFQASNLHVSSSREESPARNGHPLPPPPAENAYNEPPPPAVPKKASYSVLRRQPSRQPQQQQQQPQQQQQQQQQQVDTADKRKSWFARRFSRN